MSSEEQKQYKISEHAKRRYAERIVGKDNERDVQVYLVDYDQKIIEDVNKMITYGTLIFSGKQQKGSIVNVYSKDCWIILADPSNDTVITLYKVDLHCGDDFNIEYVQKMLQRIQDAQNILEQVKMENINESNMYRKMMEENSDQIAQYRSYIKNLEALNAGYKEIIENNTVKSSKAYQDVIDIVNNLIGKREF